VALSWSAQTNATGYAVLRGSTNGGPYSSVGTTNLTNFRDATPGLVAGGTYYYVVQPLQGSTEICQSNQATVGIP
jgi:fibronectin type 3 domain-containing protein